MECTLLLLVMLLHSGVATTAASASISRKSEESATWNMACRRCKFYIKAAFERASTPVGAPSYNSSYVSGRVANVGVVIGLVSLLLLLIIVACCVCLYCNQRPARAGHVIAVERSAMIQPVQAQEVELVDRPVAQGHGIDEIAGGGVMEQQGDERERKEEDGGDHAGKRKKRNVGRRERSGGRRDEAKKVEKEVIKSERKMERMKQVVVEQNDVDDGYVRARKIGESVDRKELLRRAREGKKPVEEEEVVVDVEQQRNSVGSPKKYTYKLLKKVTNNFNVKKKIGGGAFGSVYRAKLEDRTIVAVKCLKSEGEINDFKNEVEALGRADHPNLVKLIGYCEEGTTKILVYEYMSNGSLEKWIFPSKGSKTLIWTEMKNIIRGIAQGLEYLHDKCEKKILHRDLKPSNVILDDNKNAKLCDFGLAKLLNKDQSSTWTVVAGTLRYMSPEAIKNQRISDKVDVYSFGIVVLEVLFGKRYQQLVSSSDQTTNSEVIKLLDLINSLSKEMKKNAKEMEEFGKLALCCIKEAPGERPAMSDVIAAIHGLEMSWKEAKA
ncbi:hypothetical protein RND81_02G105200 [Saponaria officinalis]|uniref:Protein kinase domain-containing protein n=1 Tax=Saponaria officinalis TaxID=3572 RepID=A0AAW1MPI7_SAPOF